MAGAGGRLADCAVVVQKELILNCWQQPRPLEQTLGDDGDDGDDVVAMRRQEECL